MVSWCPAPPMAQVSSVLSLRQLVEIPRRLSIHTLLYLHPLPGTHPLQQAVAAEGIAFLSSILSLSALSLFGMLLGRRTDSVLFFGFRNKFDFNRTCVHGILSRSPGDPSWFSLVILNGMFLELIPVKKLRSKKSRKLFTEEREKMCWEKQNEISKDHCLPQSCWKIHLSQHRGYLEH